MHVQIERQNDIDHKNSHTTEFFRLDVTLKPYLVISWMCTDPAHMMNVQRGNYEQGFERISEEHSHAGGM